MKSSKGLPPGLQKFIEIWIEAHEQVRDYILRLWFEEGLDVSIYELDFCSLFVEENPGGVFESLREPKRFAQVRGDYALMWPNPKTGAYYDEKAIDLAPECIRFFCQNYEQLLKGPGEAAQQEKVTA